VAKQPGKPKTDGPLGTTEVANAALFYPEPGRMQPYYIVAPPYAQDSAGIKMLYVLCHLLNLLGAKAYIHVVPYALTAHDLGSGLATPALTQAIIEQNYVSGITPVVVLSETAQQNPFSGGVVVRWVMNFVGHLGGPSSFSAEENIYCYSKAIEDQTPNSRGVLFLPGSNPQFFCRPEDESQRAGVCYYAGKYVEIHKQEIPDWLEQSGTKITRGYTGQNRDELKTIFQTHEVLYIFENTALATEALLCGCVVVAMRNDYFGEMIAQAEHGSSGLTWSHTPAAIKTARQNIEQFAHDYAACEVNAFENVKNFLAQTQGLAVKKSAPAKLISGKPTNIVARYDRFSHLLRQLLRSSIEQGIGKTWKNFATNLIKKLGKN
jgi:uncharacterized MAPEG superfamily protein